MAKLAWPTLLCNSLETGQDGAVTGYRLRQKNGKKEAVKAFKSLNITVFAAGDSFNDLAMIREADAGCLFRAPESIKKDCADIRCTETYEELLAEINRFLDSPASTV
jgi:phosphoserine/homoserine phosphotransferase